MTEILLPTQSYNSDLLTAELKQALGAACSGVSSRKGVYVAHLTETAPPGSDAIVLTIARAHDSAARTPEQETRAAVRTALRNTQGKAWDVLTPTEVRALLAVLLEERGLLNPDGTVKGE